MTSSRIDAWASEDRRMSATERARAKAEEAQHAEARRLATRVLAACCHDTDEFRRLADMLGLSQPDLVAARGKRPPKQPRRRSAA